MARRDPTCPDCTMFRCPCLEPEPPEPKGTKPDVAFLRWKAARDAANAYDPGTAA